MFFIFSRTTRLDFLFVKQRLAFHDGDQISAAGELGQTSSVMKLCETPGLATVPCFSPCPSWKWSTQTLHNHLPWRSCLLQAWHAWMYTASRKPDCQYVRYEVWSLACWNKHSQIVNIWLHIHMITSKQICSKYLFFLLHCTLHCKSNSFSSDDINIKYAWVFYFSDIPLTARFFTCTMLEFYIMALVKLRKF